MGIIEFLKDCLLISVVKSSNVDTYFLGIPLYFFSGTSKAGEHLECSLGIHLCFLGKRSKSGEVLGVLYGPPCISLVKLPKGVQPIDLLWDSGVPLVESQWIRVFNLL